MEPVDWAGGAPRSPRFGDVYFQSDGLAESRAVFLAGCGLPQAWAGRSGFVIAELGFGTGLNLLAALQAWRETPRSPHARLHLFSVEAYPMRVADAARALEAWPELADLAAPLLAAWPDGRAGRRRFAWPELGATLDLAVEEALPAVRGWDGRADAWFLDGFAPSANPAMWRPELLAAVAARTAPGGRLASFTVAGAARRGLADAGLQVDKRPGHGHKRERLEARAPGAPSAGTPPPRVAVVGGGIAAAALVRALADLGATVVRVDAGGADAASANPAALVAPRLDAGLGPAARLHAEAFARAVAAYRAETPGAILAHGALQLARTPNDAGRFARLAAWDGFAPGALQPLAPGDAATALDEPVAASAGGEALRLDPALVVEPAAVLARWLGEAQPLAATVGALVSDGAGVMLQDAGGRRLLRCDAVVLAAGAGAAALLPELELRPTRGQVTLAAGVGFTGAPAAWGGYALPTRDGLLYGATHGRGDARADVRAADDAANLAALARARPALAARLADTPVQGRAAVRLAVPDHLPLAGPVPGRPGVWVLGALGGRGFTLAPLLAEHVAARILGAPSPLAADLAALVDPARPAAQSSSSSS